MINNITTDKSVRLYLFLGVFFIANAICAEFMGAKIFSLEGTLGISPFKLFLFGQSYSFNLTAGVVLWPVVFVMSDIINEFYGHQGVKYLSYLGAAMIAYAFLMFFGAILLKPADFWQYSQTKYGIPDLSLAFNNVFGQGLGIIIGSLTAFLFGQVVDVAIFHRIKQHTGEKHIWLRSTGSTLISQLVDSFVVLFIAFYFYPRIVSGVQNEPWSFTLVLSIGLGNYIYKFVVAILATPIIYIVHHRIEKYLGHELAIQMKEKAALT